MSLFDRKLWWKDRQGSLTTSVVNWKVYNIILFLLVFLNVQLYLHGCGITRVSHSIDHYTHLLCNICSYVFLPLLPSYRSHRFIKLTLISQFTNYILCDYIKGMMCVRTLYDTITSKNASNFYYTWYFNFFLKFSYMIRKYIYYKV